MPLPSLRFLLLVAFGLGAALTGCLSPSSGEHAARAEIAQRIAGIRSAILARDAAGIVRMGTPDWSLRAADGATYDRVAFVARTEALFARLIAIDALTTDVDSIVFTAPGRARVEITQTMTRVERAADTGEPTRVWLRYREEQTWLRVDGAWRVQRVVFLGTPERRVLPRPV